MQCYASKCLWALKRTFLNDGNILMLLIHFIHIAASILFFLNSTSYQLTWDVAEIDRKPKQVSVGSRWPVAMAALLRWSSRPSSPPRFAFAVILLALSIPLSLSLAPPSICTRFPSVCRVPSWRLMPCEAMLTLHMVRAYILLLLFQSVRLDPRLPASSINTFILNLNPNPRRWFSNTLKCNGITWLHY